MQNFCGYQIKFKMILPSRLELFLYSILVLIHNLIFLSPTSSPISKFYHFFLYKAILLTWFFLKYRKGFSRRKHGPNKTKRFRSTIYLWRMEQLQSIRKINDSTTQEPYETSTQFRFDKIKGIWTKDERFLLHSRIKWDQTRCWLFLHWSAIT